MAEMIPDIYDKNCSDAEKKVFNWFKNDPLTSDWVVLHSLSLDSHISLINGEADFVVLAPKYGVFVVEVKGGRVERENGKWKFTDRNNKVNYKARGPFEQASDCVFSIFKLFKKYFGQQAKISNLLFGFGAMFPDIEFDYESPEFNRAQVFDIRNGCNVAQFIINLSSFCKKKFTDTYGFFDNSKMPEKSDVKAMSLYLRPNYEVQIPIITKINESEERSSVLTNEQYNTIDQISDNKRILVLGGAGTGKTIIALQTLKKSVLSSNNKVALFCYNSNLGEWLKQTAKNIIGDGNYFIGSFYSYLHQLFERANIKVGNNWQSSDFYDEAVILKALEAIEQLNEQFDYIVIDEFQDLFDEKYFMVFDSLLKGGFDRGRWIAFADFNNQDIYSAKQLNEIDSLEFLESITSFAKSKLSINCRNTIKISKEIENITGFKYKSIINQIDGVPVTYRKYDSAEDEAQKIDAVINKLVKEGVKRSDIIILSPRVFSESSASILQNHVTNYSLNGDCVQFSTIHSFKGLEKKVVILADVISYKINMKLIYIAYSRARSALYIFENKDANNERMEMLLGKM